MPDSTAFVVSIPADVGAVEGGYTYLVTAGHCIPNEALFIRWNLKKGGINYQKIEQDWIHPKDKSVDVAVLPCDIPEDVEFRAIPSVMFASDPIIEEKGIGIGDDVIVTGLFTKRSGNSRNLPILRAGIISAMPGEPLGEPSKQYTAYLVEMRSTGGLSGSPVFVVKDFVPAGKTPNLGLQKFRTEFFLIGVIRGHWQQKNIVDTGQRRREEPLNMGIAGVTPFQECSKILNGEELVKKREKADREWKKQFAMTEDHARSSDEDHPPFTQADFEAALKKASRKIEPEKM